MCAVRALPALVLAACLSLVAHIPLGAGEAPLLPPAGLGDSVLQGVFDPSRAVQPRPGDWFDFLVAYPVDPLENSLLPEPHVSPLLDKPMTLDDLPSDEEYFFFIPSFEPETAWKTVPLRLELREIEADGINAILTFAGKSHAVRLTRPVASGTDPDFPFDPPQPEPSEVSVTIGATTLTAEAVHRVHDEYGFVRWTSPDVPFGLVRFATENLDLLLIDCGQGRPPDAMSTPRTPPEPPLGGLYRKE